MAEQVLQWYFTLKIYAKYALALNYSGKYGSSLEF